MIPSLGRLRTRGMTRGMERLQKRALRIIQPDLSYAEALVALDITLL